ncbi:MAG: c-type cytochrome [Alphaproteobacteria bacterium]|nr:c-type cytochrome [Alphaproteobacteria bacterium]
MSADHDTHGEGHEGHRSWKFYTVVAVILGVITLVELAPLFEIFNVPPAGLIALSIVKFTLVVALFMHLWDDANVYTQIFVPPLFGGILMVMVLMALSSGYDPSPGVDPEPIQERYWTDYSGECTSWVKSHVSHRVYCASPPIDRDRLTAFVAPKPTGGPKAPELDLSGMSEEETKAQLVEMGKGLYGIHCVACHQAGGTGIPPAFPPLAGSDYEGFLDPKRHAGIIINGLSGEIVVNGTTYNGMMTPFGQLSDLEIAAIATYERNSWGNDHGVVTPDIVASAR